ncbi:MAG: phosphoglucomutase/phosphomannomutase family protein [Actinobacteria bacterium]|nr:phosphoglucomutase/phosphomannomutase family protein [Actinomycetota bacterium]
MTAEIRFGTDGWRSIIADDFTFRNVGLVVTAIGDYLKKAGPGKKGVFIGYDNRFLSEDFAYHSGKVLSGKGLNVFIGKEAVPTPVTAFMVKNMELDGALMITASHNPPRYNGIKFIPWYGGPATDDITGAIESNLSTILLENKGIKENAGVEDNDKKIKYIDDFEDYKNEVLGLLELNLLKDNKIRPVLDTMHGAAGKILPDILENRLGLPVKVINGNRDPLFGGMLPDPSIQNLPELKDNILNNHFDIGLALDGDGDRFGIIDGKGIFLNPNNIISICLYYLLNTRKYGPGDKVVRTVATTHLMDAICGDYGIEVVEKPVGFKHIGEEMLKGNIIIGGEESGGMSIKGHIPEKDGILAVLLVLEIQSYLNNNKVKYYLSDYLNDIYNKFGSFYNIRLDIKVNPKSRDRIMDYFSNPCGKQFCGKEVKNITTIDGAKMILEDSSWILVRPSGTEPLIRCYMESNDSKFLNDLATYTREEIMQMSSRG